MLHSDEILFKIFFFIQSDVTSDTHIKRIKRIKSIKNDNKKNFTSLLKKYTRKIQNLLYNAHLILLITIFLIIRIVYLPR